MLLAFIYTAFMAVSCTYAFLRGGAPERLTAALMLTASLLSPLVLRNPHGNFREAEWGLLIIDALDQVIMILIALRANRYWPILVAGIHTFTPLTHLVRAMMPWIDPLTYGSAAIAISYLILAILAAGTKRHRLRLARYGKDPSWTAFSTGLARRATLG